MKIKTSNMTKAITKPDYHRVPMHVVQAWRDATDTDTTKSICAYCDELSRTKCSSSCGSSLVWVDTLTLAQITLEMP